MKKHACAFAAAIVISSFSVSTTAAMNLGSLIRQHAVIAGAALTTSSIPHACGDVACGAGSRKSADISPALHTLLISIVSFARSHLDVAFEGQKTARLQMLSMASTD